MPDPISAEDSPLAEPLQLPCGSTVPNRFFKAAMNEAMGKRDGSPSALLARLYGRWADGGAGIIVTGNVMIDSSHLGEPSNVVIEHDRHLPALRQWASAGQRAGGHIWMQLNHPGRQSPSVVNRAPVGPSAVPIAGMEKFFAPPRALTVYEIAEIVQRFARSASIAKNAGFTGVQLHAAHGYLLSQFLSPAANQRDDEYGGDLTGRSRLLRETYLAVRHEVGESFPIGIKLNSSDGDAAGFCEEDALEVAVMMGQLGVDLVEVSGGTYAQPTMQADGAGSSPTFADFAHRLSEKATCPVVLTGGFRDTNTMETAVRDGVVSMVGLGRALVIDPDLPKRVVSQRWTGAITPPRITTGVGAVDRAAQSVMVNGWYELQMRRLARGTEASRTGNGWAALAATVALHGIPALLPRRA